MLGAIVAHATTDYLYSGAYGGSGGVDLNSYNVSTITSITVDGDAYGYDPGAPVNAYAEVNFSGGSFGYFASQFNPTSDTASAWAYMTATNITLNGSGDWIAAEVTGTNGTYYNVNLGSGWVEMSSFGSANGYSSASGSAYVEY
ncbi:MAG: hypothetical protein KF715_16200 [Candidatus Didemnitutus sp.]|nr:hypothetical protein [Candidatus Didemnitutus sp.]